MRSTISLQRDDDLRRPQAAFFERHELDKADDDVFFAGEAGKAFDLVVVEAAQQHAVDLEGREAGVARGANAASTLSKLPGTRVMRSKVGASTASMLTVTRFRPAALSGCGQLVEQVAVGGERQVQRLAGEGAQLASSRIRSIRPRRSSGSPPVRRTLVMPRPTKSLIRRRYSSIAKLGILRAVFAGAAVDALVVAAVGDGDAQVVDHAAVAVGQPAERRFSSGEVRKQQPSALSQAIPFCCMFAGKAAQETGSTSVRGSRHVYAYVESVDAGRSRRSDEAGEAEDGDETQAMAK